MNKEIKKKKTKKVTIITTKISLGSTSPLSDRRKALCRGGVGGEQGPLLYMSIYLSIYLSIYIYIYMYICMCIHMHIYIYI